MNVDLLKPGIAPIPPETLLPFEFLLDKNLLLRHLQKPDPDPSAIDLIVKFYKGIQPTVYLEEGPKVARVYTPIVPLDVNISKNKAMKVMALKTVAYLNWNLAAIKSLTFKTQVCLIQDLILFTSDDSVVMNLGRIGYFDVSTASPQFQFAMLLCHRWVLSVAMSKADLPQNLGRITDEPLPEMVQPLLQPAVIIDQENADYSFAFMIAEVLNWKSLPPMLTFDCFKIPTDQTDAIEFDWKAAKEIPRDEIFAQIYYEMGTYAFFRDQFELALQYFQQCQQLNVNITERQGFAVYERRTLDIYLAACKAPLEVTSKSLIVQLDHSIVNHYMGITGILQQDNVQKEIALARRITLELDIEGALSSGAFTVARDLLFKVKALNLVRCVIDKSMLSEFNLAANPKALDTFFSAIQVNWLNHTEEDQKSIKNYLIQLIIKDEIPEIQEKIRSHLPSIFDETEWQYIVKREPSPATNIPPDILFHSDPPLLDPSKKRKPRMELRQLTKQLFATYDWKEIKDLLMKINMTNMGVVMWEINAQWELPIPLQSVIKSLPRGVLQDIAYVLLAKSKEQMQNRNWMLALQLIFVLENELQSATCNVAKLSKMLKWEILLVQITQLLEEWPRRNIDTVALANACEACLQTNDSVLPRTEIVEHCAICLLNLGRWQFLIGHDKRWTTFEIMSAIALASHEMFTQKDTIKRFSKNLWDIVLPVFANANSSMSKRGGAPSSGYHEAGNLKANVMSVFSKLKDAMCLTVVVSLLTKLYNIFRDEPSLELVDKFMNLWPATVSNANSYNLSATSEVLTEVLTRALKEYPTNKYWLRVMGDLHYADGSYEISLSYYLKSLIITNDYFNVIMNYKDYIIRRMIKCCQATGNYTQAAVLCQFLDDPDYALAFRLLSDQKTFEDAVDAYYHCFWDTNILEFLVNIHNRRGEFQRRKCTVHIMGTLELNANNHVELLKEASNLRKKVFLRALCKQFVF